MEHLNKMQYQVLTDYLIQRLPSGYAYKFSSWIDRAELLPYGRNITQNGIELMQIQYDTTFYFDELPFKKIQPLALMAHIQSWLYEQDTTREEQDLANPEMTIELLDDNTAIVEFTLSFNESIYAIESETGDLMLNNKKYALGNIEIYTAHEFEIIPKGIK